MAIARHLASLRSFFRFGQREGWAKTNPAKPLRNPRKGRSLPHFLSAEDLGRLFDAPPADEPMGLRDRAILETMYSAGLRVSEVVGLDDGDLDFDAGDAPRPRQGTHASGCRPSAPTPPARCERWLPVRKLHARVPAGPAAPVFVNKFGRRLTTRSVGRMLEKYLQAHRPRPPHHAALAAAQLRHASVGPRRRHPQRAGTAGPQEPGDHADLHARQHGGAARSVRAGASAGEIAQTSRH